MMRSSVLARTVTVVACATAVSLANWNQALAAKIKPMPDKMARAAAGTPCVCPIWPLYPTAYPNWMYYADEHQSGCSNPEVVYWEDRFDIECPQYCASCIELGARAARKAPAKLAQLKKYPPDVDFVTGVIEKHPKFDQTKKTKVQFTCYLRLDGEKEPIRAKAFQLLIKPIKKKGVERPAKLIWIGVVIEEFPQQPNHPYYELGLKQGPQLGDDEWERIDATALRAKLAKKDNFFSPAKILILLR